MIELEPFLTSYDPSDLPGASIDPLGFEKGYLLLADKILPGLTNVASRPRYFSLLCSGAYIADDAPARAASRETPRDRYRWRLDCTLRIEQFWALANILATASSGSVTLSASGIRGVRYAQAHAARLADRNAKETRADFKLLSRQMPYGVVGIYASVADGMRMLDRETLAPTPGLGLRLAEAFVEETDLPGRIRDAVVENGAVSLSILSQWGQRAHISGAVRAREGACLADALHQHPVRRRMARLLEKHRPREGEAELPRLSRIGRALERQPEDADLREAITAIVTYEECYRSALLGFLRLLWMCQTHEPFSIDMDRLDEDEVLKAVGLQLRAAYDRLAEALRNGTTDAFRRDLHRLHDVERFLQQASVQPVPRPFCEVLLQRHADVQRAKLDGGRPKMPWLEIARGRIVPTLGRALRVDAEPARATDIAPHGYRVASADALLAAAGIA